jgi:capsular exopolysaccharide synthesis family protein
MDSTPPQSTPSAPGEHGSAAPGYGYGYGYEYDGTIAQRTFQQYLLTLRERVWYIIAVFLLLFSSVLVYTLTRQKLYQSTATVQIFRRDPVVMQVQGILDNEVRSAEDLNTQVKLLESASIIQKVATRLTGPDLERLLAPYRRPDGPAPSAQGIIAAGRQILLQRVSLIVNVQYQHRDPVVAAQVANLIADEYIAYNEKVRTDESLKAVEDLRDRAEEQRKKVDQLAVDLQAYRERSNLVSLDQRKDINTEKLKALNVYLTDTSNRLSDAEVRWEQVQQRRAKHQELTDLPFIASPPITQLTQQLAAQQIVIAQLRERYRDKHPKMIESVNSLAQIRRELDRAVGAAADAVQADYQTALNNNLAARKALVTQEADSLKLDRYAVDYDNLQRQYEVNVKLLEQILSRMSETSVSGTIESQSARIVDHAVPSYSPVSPNIRRDLGLGFIGALVFSVAFAFFLAFIDDRVKSMSDIEGVVGLPLLGVVPHMKGQDFMEKATVVANDADLLVSEAFRSLYASLRLKEGSKSAKCLLVTSTLPGEGKSFIVSNLALAFAAHGERTLIIDADLRRPSIHRSFGKENKRGLVDVVAGRITPDEAILRDVHPNLDILPTGGRANNPTQILNNPAFERLIAELRPRYDRIFFDTPPMAAVSDALMILPLADGCLFNLRFNKVRRKTAQFCVRKLLNTTVPCFGAVLNNLNLAISGYYYSQYYHKSYKDYYMTSAPDGATPAGGSRKAKG